MPDRFQEETPEEAAMLARRRRELWAEPFFTTEPPCPECGHPLSACVCNIPDEPVCPDLELACGLFCVVLAIGLIGTALYFALRSAAR